MDVLFLHLRSLGGVPERPFTRKKVVNMRSSQEKIFILVFTTFLVTKKVVNTYLFIFEIFLEENHINFQAFAQKFSSFGSSF